MSSIFDTLSCNRRDEHRVITSGIRFCSRHRMWPGLRTRASRYTAVCHLRTHRRFNSSTTSSIYDLNSSRLRTEPCRTLQLMGNGSESRLPTLKICVKPSTEVATQHMDAGLRPQCMALHFQSRRFTTSIETGRKVDNLESVVRAVITGNDELIVCLNFGYER